MMIKGDNMFCEFCDGKTINKKVTKEHWLDGKLYVVENVEAEVCLECDERYFHAKTLDSIEKLLNAEHEVKENINVEVVSL